MTKYSVKSKLTKKAFREWLETHHPGLYVGISFSTSNNPISTYLRATFPGYVFKSDKDNVRYWNKRGMAFTIRKKWVQDYLALISADYNINIDISAGDALEYLDKV